MYAKSQLPAGARRSDLQATRSGPDQGSDAAGELGQQGFTRAQLGSPLSVVLIVGGLVRSLLRPREARRMLAEVRRGYRMGQVAQPFLPVRFEDPWSRPLSDWRTSLGIPV